MYMPVVTVYTVIIPTIYLIGPGVPDDVQCVCTAHWLLAFHTAGTLIGAQREKIEALTWN